MLDGGASGQHHTIMRDDSGVATDNLPRCLHNRGANSVRSKAPLNKEKLMNAVPETCRYKRLKLVLAGTFLLSWMRIAWRVTGCVVVVQGESMLPNFHPNDYALTSPAPKNPTPSERLTARTGS